MSNRQYRQTEYISSAHKLSQMPDDVGAEVAFVGRSNVGKSSVINTITGIKGLARTSKTPGRTQQINFFSVIDDRRLVDLPGYGYAKVPKDLQAHWAKTLQRYFEIRQSLKGLILIIDIRRGLSDVDQQMLQWCQSVDLPVHILLNKSDKLAFGAAKKALLSIRQGVAGQQAQLFSATKKQGIDEACLVLDRWLFSDEAEDR